MHELSIMQSVVEICEAHAEGCKVSEVVLEVGELSGLVPESIEFCFEACCTGTVLEGARLTLELVPGRGICPHCKIEAPLAAVYDPCPGCGAFGLTVISGQELRVKELELD